MTPQPHNPRFAAWDHEPPREPPVPIPEEAFDAYRFGYDFERGRLRARLHVAVLLGCAVLLFGLGLLAIGLLVNLLSR